MNKLTYQQDIGIQKLIKFIKEIKLPLKSGYLKQVKEYIESIMSDLNLTDFPVNKVFMIETFKKLLFKGVDEMAGNGGNPREGKEDAIRSLNGIQKSI